MASFILQPLRLSDKDISDLKEVLYSEITFYRENPLNVFAGDFCTWLNLIAGLGCTAVLSDKYDRYQSEYMQHFNSYLEVRKDLPKGYGAADVKVVSQSITNMVRLALKSFPYNISRPLYLNDFIEALRQTTCRAILREPNHLKENSHRIYDLINSL